MKPKSIELFAIDKNHQLQYEGKCKIRINRLSSMILVEPENEEFKMKSAMFNWDFVMDKNILFVFGEHELNDFALIFDEEKRCKKVYNFISTEKVTNNVDKKTLNQRFLVPFCKLIAMDDLPSQLKRTFVKWIDKHESKEKGKYVNLLKENNIYDIVYGKTNDKSITQNTDVTAGNKMEHNPRKRRHSEKQECDGNRVNKNSLVAMINQKSSKSFTKIVIQADFKYVNLKINNRLVRRLLIFVTAEKTHCYEYSWNNRTRNYCCIGCKNRYKNTAIIDKDENGFECIKMENKKHACTPTPHTPEKYIELKMLKKPEYEILENCNKDLGKILVIFDPNEKTRCWEFRADTYQNYFLCYKCSIAAKLWNANTENEYVELRNANHKCPSVPYEPKKHYRFNEFVLPPDFKIQVSKGGDGKERKMLIIFDKNDRNLCYIYLFCKNIFYCNGCKNKRTRVYAKLLQNSDGENYVILSPKQHVCELRPYSSVSKNEEFIIRPPDFELMDNTENGVKKLFIFDSKNRNLCRIFSYKHSRYYCLGCQNIQYRNRNVKKEKVKIPSAKLYKDENDEYHVQLNDSTHACEPTKYEPKNYANTRSSISCPALVNINRKQKKKKITAISSEISVRNIIRPPNFELSTNVKGVKDGTLFVFHSEDRSIGFKYFYSNFHKCYKCSKTDNCRATAKLEIDENDGKRVILGPNEHKCKRKRYEKVVKCDQIDASEFITLSQNGKITKVIVFTTPNHEECYEYGPTQKETIFKCLGCKRFHKYVTVKICKDKNDQKYLEMSKQEHLCQPRKYIKEKYGQKTVIPTELFELHPNTKGEANKRLIIFTSAKKDFVYEYGCFKSSYQCLACDAKKHNVSAKLHENEKGENYIECGTQKHACEPRKYDPEKYIYSKPKILSNDMFVFHINGNGEKDKYLLIFTSEKKDFVYRYSMATPGYYHCNRCHNKKQNVTAKIIEDESGIKSVVLGKNEHVCEPRKYDPQHYVQCEFVTNERFLLHDGVNGEKDKHLIIFKTEKKDFMYQYSLKQPNWYYCNGCKRKQQSVSAKLFENDDGEKVFKLGKKQHVCEPQKYDSRKFKTNKC